MKSSIFHTNDSWAPFLIRGLLGLVVFPHGAQKLFGWFGGYGFTGTIHYFTDTLGLPGVMGLLVIVLETLGAVALMMGIATRLLALAYLFLAGGIVFTSHWQHGFFMNWYGNQAGEGYEYFILWSGMALALIITGGGRFSIDSFLVGRNQARVTETRKSLNVMSVT